MAYPHFFCDLIFKQRIFKLSSNSNANTLSFFSPVANGWIPFCAPLSMSWAQRTRSSTNWKDVRGRKRHHMLHSERSPEWVCRVSKFDVPLIQFFHKSFYRLRNTNFSELGKKLCTCSMTFPYLPPLSLTPPCRWRILAIFDTPCRWRVCPANDKGGYNSKVMIPR